MNENIIITSGKKYIDIDGYAGMFAYRKLLQSLGYNAYAVTSACLNQSIPKIITCMNFKFDNIKITKDTKFIILDISNPDFLEDFVNKNNIIEIIDHHTGYEKYWDNFKVKKQIEFIGSICTIIYEKFVKYNKEMLLTPELCKILMAGILDNTLNLKSKNTTKRDINAYKSLARIGKINKNWPKIYFKSCYGGLSQNLEKSIKNDIKIEKIGNLLPNVFGQLIVLEKNIIFNNMNIVLSAFKEYENWIFNVICLDDGKSYIFFSDKKVKENLQILFNGVFLDNHLILNNYMLRKEIMKIAREKQS